MLATPERTRDDHDRPLQLWHLLADGHTCNGDCDWHPIACSREEGIALPGGTRDVPVDLDEPGQRWCGDCLAIHRDQVGREAVEPEVLSAATARRFFGEQRKSLVGIRPGVPRGAQP